MSQLSVNINKIATLRNARGSNKPNVVTVAQDCERFGAQGITVHPRPDERHITTQDVYDLKTVVKTEFNIEGYPDARFLKIIEEVKPTQATLVPDPPEVLTSNAGWDTHKQGDFLRDVVEQIKSYGVRCSIFVEPSRAVMDGAIACGTDRVELFTEMYAAAFPIDPSKAVGSYADAAKYAVDLGLQLNAGHDLDLSNLKFFKQSIPDLLEVSIGHALVCDALYYGLENVIPMYKRLLD
ncbi:MAG: pyridoxine 5'-phosphate synthase [Bacteroidota bacterium]